MSFDMHHLRRDGDGSHFRLTVAGMNAWLPHMLDTEMAFEDDPHPPWPQDVDAYGIRDVDVEVVQNPERYAEDLARMSPDVVARTRRYLADLDAVLRWHGKAVTGIPTHKLHTNDCWIVTADECRGAVANWRGNGSRPPTRAADDWSGWIDFLERAVDRDGFEVL